VRRIDQVMLQLLAAIVASIVGVLSSLTTIVFLMTSLANAKPLAIQQGKGMMWGIVAVQAICLTLAIWLMTRHKHWYASMAGIFPLVVVVVLIIILVKLEW
jgi:hypothetical protein